MGESHAVDTDEIRIRRATPRDADTLKRLFETNPDGGDVQFAPTFETDPYETYTRLVPADDIVGLLAETPTGRAVGAGFVAVSEARIGGEIRPRGYLAGLVVDNEYRGNGIAKELATARIRTAEETAGADVVIAAAIQSGNEPSKAVARSWADGFPYEYCNHSVSLRETEPESGFAYETVDASDLSTFVEGINRFYRDAEMYVPYEEDSLAAMLETPIEDEYVHRCDMLARDGEYVAGAHLIEQHKLLSAVVESLPPELEDADELPPSIPDDREIRPTFAIPWFKPGHPEAGDAVIEHVRANAGRANRVMIPFDPGGPLGQVDVLTPDEGTLRLNWALRGLEEPIPDAYVAPGIG